jgi:hypothetical protein
MNGLGVLLFASGFLLLAPVFGLEGVLLAQIFVYAVLCLSCMLLMKKEANLHV